MAQRQDHIGVGRKGELELGEQEEHIPGESGERVTVTTGDATSRTGAATHSTYPEARTAGAVRHRPALDHDRDVEIPEALNLRRDRVHWGPIFAGLLTALTTLFLLSLLGLAIGLTTINAGDAAGQGGPPSDVGRNSAIWGGISAILSFLLGGYVAGRTSAVFNRGWGAFNGAMVFLLGVPLMLWLASQGLGGVLGTVGSFAGGLNADPGQVQNATQNAADQARQAGTNVQPIDVARAAERARNAAWGTLLGSLLGLGSSALGGYLGTRRTVEIDRRTGLPSD